jgi:hypothetical protein
MLTHLEGDRKVAGVERRFVQAVSLRREDEKPTVGGGWRHVEHTAFVSDVK